MRQAPTSSVERALQVVLGLAGRILKDAADLAAGQVAFLAKSLHHVENCRACVSSSLERVAGGHGMVIGDVPENLHFAPADVRWF